MTDEQTTEAQEEEKPTEQAEESSKEEVQTENTEGAEETTVEESEPAEEATPESTGPAYKTKLVGFEELKPGQTIRLHEKIKDISPKGLERERIQVFEGIILGIKGGGVSRTLTIKKMCKGNFAVEKIFPINSPLIDKFELVKTAKVRRAKLAYLKNPKRRFKRKLREVHEKN